jgi:hypothetical protein
MKILQLILKFFSKMIARIDKLQYINLCRQLSASKY